MAKIDKYIQIVRTDTTRQSSMGLKSCLMILDVLRRSYARVEIVTVNGVLDLQAAVAKQPDVVFLGLKRTSPLTEADNYSADDDVWVSAYLAEHGVNYTGSSHRAIILDLNKNLAKQTVAAAGLPTAGYFMAEPGQYGARQLPLGFPLFIKPPTQGGGKGIAADSIARSFADYECKVQQIYETYGTPALIETYLEGREFSVALLGSAEEALAMPIELLAEPNEHGDRILGAQIKADDTERVIAVTAGPMRDRLMQLSKDIYSALGARDYGRIDIRMDAQGNPHFLEANLVPGVANHDFISYFTHACMINEDMDYESMILRIIEISLSRASPNPASIESTGRVPTMPAFKAV